MAKAKTFRGAEGSLKAAVSGAGRLTVAGARVRAAKAVTTAAGDYAVRVSLSTSARRSLKRHHRLRTSLTVTFTPKSGTPVTATVHLTFASGR